MRSFILLAARLLPGSSFELKAFDIGNIVHIIIHAICGVLILSGFIIGGQKIIESKNSGDPKDRSDGISGIFWALVIGGVIEVVSYMII